MNVNIKNISERILLSIGNSEHLSLSELAKRLETNIQIIALSAGWLAAENKICLYDNGSDIELSLINQQCFYSDFS